MTRKLNRRISIGRVLPLLSLLAMAAAPALVGFGFERPARGQDAALSSRIREQMQPFVDKGEVSGVVTLVGGPDGVLSLEALGRRNIERDLPMRPDNLFRIASMTKPIT